MHITNAADPIAATERISKALVASGHYATAEDSEVAFALSRRIEQFGPENRHWLRTAIRQLCTHPRERRAAFVVAKLSRIETDDVEADALINEAISRLRPC